MKENIKILEEWLKELNELFEKTRINNTKERKALENLIKAYKKLEKENDNITKQLLNEILDGADYISKSLIKEMLEEIDEEFYRLDKEVDIDMSKPNKTIQEFYEYKEKITTMQTLSWFKGRLEELLTPLKNV